jgi:hypothetical protein
LGGDFGGMGMAAGQAFFQEEPLSLSLGSWPHPNDINSDDLTRELNYSPFLTHSTVN